MDIVIIVMFMYFQIVNYLEIIKQKKNMYNNIFQIHLKMNNILGNLIELYKEDVLKEDLIFYQIQVIKLLLLKLMKINILIMIQLVNKLEITSYQKMLDIDQLYL